MFGISGLELLVILIVAVLVLKPEDVPAMAEKAGRFVRKIRKAIDSIKKDLNG
jgi:sec-independent protein translocase protein TatB